MPVLTYRGYELTPGQANDGSWFVMVEPEGWTLNRSHSVSGVTREVALANAKALIDDIYIKKGNVLDPRRSG